MPYGDNPMREPYTVVRRRKYLYREGKRTNTRISIYIVAGPGADNWTYHYRCDAQKNCDRINIAYREGRKHA